MPIVAERHGDGPIICNGLHPSLGDNINGPSLIVRPDWLAGPGRYWLYFSHHKGRHIRLARADALTGTWQVYGPGVLPLVDTPFAQKRPDLPQPDWAVATGQDGLYPHLASPDVWVNDAERLLEMWVHGLDATGDQVSYRAVSANGLDWQITGPATPDTYLRVFAVQGRVYAMARLGRLMCLVGDVFQPGPMAIPMPGARQIRHVAVLVRDDRLHVTYSCLGDAPERLFHTMLDLSRAYPDWPQCAPETEVLRPECDWEGARLPVTPGLVGAIDFSHALRDPALFDEHGQVWMVYAGGGEAALGLARLDGL